MIESIQILPGVHLTAVQTEKFKTGCFSVNLLRPLCREEAALNALLPNVLLRGTKEYPTMQAISAFLDERYGASVGSLVRKRGEVQTVGFYADFLSDRLAPDGSPILQPMIEFVCQTLLKPVRTNWLLEEPYVSSEQLNLINAIEANLNEKRSYAARQLVKTMCAGEAYGVSRLGETEEVRAITPQSLTDHWQKVLAGSRAEIFYLGAQAPETVAGLFAEQLQRLPREELSQPRTQVIRHAEAVKERFETLDVTQGKLCMGLRTGITSRDPEYPALVLLNAVFGAGTTSKLFLNVREAKSLCYYASSGIDAVKGIMTVSSGIEFEKYDEARAAILEQLDRCRQGEISDKELSDAKRHLDSGLRMQADSPGGLDNFYVGQAITGLNGTLEGLRERIGQVTKEQVIATAQSLSLDTVYFLKGVEA
ncbi:MAG: insulinase family protein [Oscillospiraceae bacterium]|nr:insulinase family protein [Oscillospiraceae bacterium]